MTVREKTVTRTEYEYSCDVEGCDAVHSMMAVCAACNGHACQYHGYDVTVHLDEFTRETRTLCTACLRKIGLLK